MKIDTQNSMNVQNNKSVPSQKALSFARELEGDSGNSSFADFLDKRNFEKNSKNSEPEKSLDNKTKETDTSNKNEETKARSEEKNAEKEFSSEKDSSTAENQAGLSHIRSDFAQTYQVKSESVPARAILHIADLEKLVSSVKVQLLSGNQTQVLIDLNNSVLSGLQIRMTSETDGRIKAEFIAPNEKVKHQIDAKLNELSEVLRNRGIDFSSVKSEFNGTPNQDQKQEKEEIFVENTTKNFKKAETSTENDLPDSDDNQENNLQGVYRA